MLSDLGSYCLISGIVFGVFSIVYPYMSFRTTYVIPAKAGMTNNGKIPTFAGMTLSLSAYRLTQLAANLCVIFSFLILLTLFITRDFRVISVLTNTSSIMELKYRIAACWSSHETSLLFWVFITSILNIIFIFQTRAKETIANSVSQAIQLCFLLCIFIYANPFKSITTTPTEGLGMNPSLQDIGIMIHPPLLYIAYGIFQIIFSCNISALLGRNVDTKLLLHWSRFGFSILTGAVCLGGWWAYRELGWGGYWFFDPVENISLIIWLFAISYHHSLLQKNMELTKIILGVAPFLCALCGTFLVRSGLLTSVHSFAESKSSFVLLIFSISMLLSTFLLIGYRAYRLETTDEQKSLKYWFMQAGNILWSFAGFILIVSLLIPIISLYFFHEPIEVKPNFFIKTVIPVMLFSSILSGTIYFNRKLPRMLILCALNLIIFAISYLIYKASLLQAFSYYTGSIIISGSIIRWVEKIKSKTLHTSSISMLLGHIGAGIFIIAVCFNNQFGYSKTLNLSVQEKAEIKGDIQAYLIDIKYSASKNYLRQVVNIRLLDKDNEISTLNPELRNYPVEKSLSSEVDIYSIIYNDWYAVINNIDGNKVSLQIFYHPGISFIWLSVFIVCFAIILRSIKS